VEFPPAISMANCNRESGDEGEASTRHRESRCGNGWGETRGGCPPAISLAICNHASGEGAGGGATDGAVKRRSGGRTVRAVGPDGPCARRVLAQGGRVDERGCGSRRGGGSR